MNLTLTKRTARLEAGHGCFDATGRDTGVIAVMKFVAECKGTTFDIQSVPAGFTSADLYSSIAACPNSRIVQGDPNTSEWATHSAKIKRATHE